MTDDFATVLRRLRRTAGLTQEEVAAASGLSVEGISALERGQRRRPHAYTVDALVGGLGLSAEDAEELRTSMRPARKRTTSAADGLVVRPQQLPAAPPTYVGRGQEVESLVEALSDPGAQSAPRRVAITGMGGVGKSSLATLVANRVADCYPDGQIYLDLCGHGDREPVTTGAALAYILTSLGGRDTRVPSDPALAQAQLRTMTNGARMLFVLDNASGPDQIESLLPTSAASAVVITSRHSFDGLLDIEHRPLGLLSDDTAERLLCEVVGEDRMASDEESTQRLVAACAGLPLALRLVAGRLLAHPDWPLRQLADQLASNPARLGRLRHGEIEVGRTLLAAVDQLATSHDPTDHDAAAALHVVGLLPSAVVSPLAIAAATGWVLRRAEAATERLVHLNLVEEPLPGQYRAHDLVHAVAADSAVEDAGEDSRRAVRLRVLKAYRAVSWRSRSLTRPAPLGIDEAVTVESDLADGDPVACVDQIASDFDQVVALVKDVANHGEDEARVAAHVVLGLITYYVSRVDSSGWGELLEYVRDRLPSNAVAEWTGLHLDLALFHAVRGHLEATLENAEVVILAAQLSGDVATEAAAHSVTAMVWRRLGHPRHAEHSCTRALELSLESGDKAARARAYRDLGLMRFRIGEHQAGIAAQREALSLYRELDFSRGVAMALINVGVMLRDTGELSEARECLETAVECAQEVADRPLEAEALEELGYWHIVSGEPNRGMEILKDGLDRVEVRGGGRGEGGLRHRLGLALDGLGRRDEAVEHWQLAVRLHEQHGDHSAAANVRRLLEVRSLEA